MNLPVDQMLKLLVAEVFLRRKLVVGAFIAVNVVLLSLGLWLPKGYVSSTTILVAEKNIIQPLMQGAAVTTDVTDRARLAREIVLGRKVMDEVAEHGGWATPDTLPLERERIIEQLTQRVTISNVGKNLIKIAYHDDLPERAFKTTQKFAELFINESLGTKVAESQAAFEFIDKQTGQYHQKLLDADEKIKQYRTENLDARVGGEADVGVRLNTIQARLEQASQELREAEVRKASLERQLSGEVESVTAVTREGQYRVRISELQSQLDMLRLNYHETYPDIVRIKHQIEDLNEAIVQERTRRETAKASGRPVVDDSVVNNPQYQQLRRELSQTQTQIDTLTARLSESRKQLNSEIDRGKRMHGGEATVAELTRDYQVNREIYQDLLKRRENARVSMSLDKEKQGLAFKIQEPAMLPLQPTGLRFGHFVIAGVLLGVLLPLGGIYAQLMFDPRIRAPMAINDKLKLPILATVPHYWGPQALVAASREISRLGYLMAGTFMVIAVLSVLRVTGVL